MKASINEKVQKFIETVNVLATTDVGLTEIALVSVEAVIAASELTQNDVQEIAIQPSLVYVNQHGIIIKCPSWLELSNLLLGFVSPEEYVALREKEMQKYPELKKVYEVIGSV
jgi:hypothetical protein